MPTVCPECGEPPDTNPSAGGSLTFTCIDGRCSYGFVHTGNRGGFTHSGDRDDPYRFLCGGQGPDVHVVRVLRLFQMFGMRVLHLIHDDHPRDGA